MSKGYAFPDLVKLERWLILRGWTPAVLADKAHISIATSYDVLAGRRVSVETLERVCRAMLTNPPDPASSVVRFLAADE